MSAWGHANQQTADLVANQGGPQPAASADQTLTWDQAFLFFPWRLTLPVWTGQPFQGHSKAKIPVHLYLNRGVALDQGGGWHQSRLRWKQVVPRPWKDLPPFQKVLH